jgi:hypothetical protein
MSMGEQKAVGVKGDREYPGVRSITANGTGNLDLSGKVIVKVIYKISMEIR